MHAFEPCPNDGPVMVTREYRIDPARGEEFTNAMQAVGAIRRHDGAIQWGLYQDLSDPGRFVETAIVESWAEHKRQFERVTNADRATLARVDEFHIDDKPPKVTQMIYSDYANGRDPQTPC